MLSDGHHRSDQRALAPLIETLGHSVGHPATQEAASHNRAAATDLGGVFTSRPDLRQG